MFKGKNDQYQTSLDELCFPNLQLSFLRLF